jgi:Leucine-rich repeat (LRR) protein
MCSLVRHGGRLAWAVTNISLPSAGIIHGRLDGLNFSALPFLAYIDLSSNGLHETSPGGISSLSALFYLNLSNNNLTGQAPYEMGGLQSLTLLALYSNNLLPDY